MIEIIRKNFLTGRNLAWILILICSLLIFIPLASSAINNLTLYSLLERLFALILWVIFVFLILHMIRFIYIHEIIFSRSLILLLAGIFVVTFVIDQQYATLLDWVETPRKAYWPLLAQSFLHGKLYFLNTPPTTHDLIFFQGNWYLPPPPLPALVIMPYLRLVGLENVNTVFLSILFASINSVIIYLILDQLRKMHWISLSPSTSLWLVALFAFGTPHFYMGIIGMEWEVSKILAVTFLALSIYFALKAWSPWLVGFLLGTAMASRPNLFVIWPFLLTIAIQIIQERAKIPFKKAWRQILGWSMKSAIPVILVVLSLLTYNYLRFGDPLDFGYINLNGATSIVEDVQKYGIYNIHFIPRNLTVMFLNLPEIRSYFPYLFPSLQGMSMLVTSPALLYLIHKYDKKWWTIGAWLSVALSIILLSMYHNTGAAQFGYGYMLDFLIPLIMLLAFALGKNCPKFFCFLVILSILINTYGVWWFLHFA